MRNQTLSRKDIFLKKLQKIYLDKFEKNTAVKHDWIRENARKVLAKLDKENEKADFILDRFGSHPFHLLVFLIGPSIELADVNELFLEAISLGFPFLGHKVEGISAFNLSAKTKNQYTNEIYVDYIASHVTGLYKV